MSLAPTLLVSMPQLTDPNFARTVVLLCEHTPQGALGLIVNRPSDVMAAEAVHMEPPLVRANDLPLLIGGPVEPERGWILTTTVPEVEPWERMPAALVAKIAALISASAPPLTTTSNEWGGTPSPSVRSVSFSNT